MMYYGDKSEDFVCKIATTEEEWIQYIEQGFELVDKDEDGSWYFKKREWLENMP